MKVFKEFNQDSICPICGTNKSGEAVLIPINGTEDGWNMEAMQVHLSCIDLAVSKNLFLDGSSVILQIFNEVNIEH